MSDGFQSAYPPGVAIVSGVASSQEADVGQAGETPESGLAHARTRGIGPDPPLRRWRDVRAELPALRAQLQRAERKRDVERERLVAAALARALVKRRAE